MVDSQFSSATATQMEDGLFGSEVAVQPDLERLALKRLDGLTLNQIVLKGTNTVKPSEPSGSGSVGSSAIISARVLDATQRLVELLGQLRSPSSGWPVDVPQSPETLLPYVLEEACDLREALQEMLTEASAGNRNAAGLDADQWLHHRLQHPGLVSSVAPWLLWAIARSAYDIMGLLEGITARVFQPDQGWQTGCLRLVAFLQINLPEQFNGELDRLDLTTHQPVQALLPSTVMVQTVDNDLCQEPIWVEGLLQGLLQHIQTMTPVLAPIIHGLPVEVLVPHQSWTTGSVQLQIGLEFVASEVPPSESELQSTPQSTPQSTSDGTAIAPESAVNPILRFTDPAWLQHYTSTVSRQQLSSFMTYIFSAFEAGAMAIAASDPGVTETSDAIAQTIQDACKAADFLQTALTVSSRNFPQRDWSINEVSLRLLWSISRSAYEIMPLLTGIQSDVLEPGAGWQSGLLRLVVCLHMQTPELDWRLDLVTGDLLPENHGSLASNAVVQFHQTDWQQPPTLLKDLGDRIMQHIQRATPELQLFLTGTCIDLLDAEQHWQPGTLLLSTEFQFLPKRM